MANSCVFPDVFSWIQNLPPITQWQKNTPNICLCSSTSIAQSSLKLTISKNNQNPTLCNLSIIADFNLPISLWTSRPLKFMTSKLSPSPSNNNYHNSLDNQQTILLPLFHNFIEDVLNYGSNNNNNNSIIKFLRLDHPSLPNVKETFNLAFLTLFFLICIYEAPLDLRRGCLDTIKSHLADCQSRKATKLLMKMLGSNLEEQWMRSVNLAVTNWIAEVLRSRSSAPMIKTPSSLFSYSVSTFGLWKVQLYCPLIAMNVESTSSTTTSTSTISTTSTSLGHDDQRLQFSLNYHQLEGVVQFNYKVVPRESWVGVLVNIDNIRCDVVKLVNETLMSEQGVGSAEKHFPSRISLQLTPTMQTNVLSVSVNKSSENPVREIGLEKTVEAGFEPPNTYLGLKVTAGETVTMSLKPWKFEESVQGCSANLNWYLHDSVNGREVFSSKPSKIALLNPKAWFKHRYSSAHRPFTRQGGVVFAGDEYGESVVWKVDKAAMGKTMEWEIRGWIWLTYWPNKYRTCYTESRRLEFREILSLAIS